jgi:hypothetical protein
VAPAGPFANTTRVDTLRAEEKVIERLGNRIPAKGHGFDSSLIPSALSHNWTTDPAIGGIKIVQCCKCVMMNFSLPSILQG